MTIRIKILNKHLAAITWGNSTPVIEGNPFEMAKQYCILDAYNKLPLPRSVSFILRFEDDYPDLQRWYGALTNPNSPTKISYRANPARFRELVEPLDFSKPFDEKLVESIKQEFSGVSKKLEINADDLINAELAD